MLMWIPDYSTWFAKSSMRPIIGDVLVSEGRVLKGIVSAQVATGAECRRRLLGHYLGRGRFGKEISRFELP